MSFTIVRQDITKMKVDAVVNAANTELLMGGGVCGAIFLAAGPEKLQKACDKVAPIRTGQAVITPGFALPAKYVVHAAGPVYDPDRKELCETLLRSAYLESLALACRHGCKSIAFPLISGGIYGYPKAEALQVATAAIRDFLTEQEMEVYLAVFDKKAFVVSEALMGEVASYIDENYVDLHLETERSRPFLESELRHMGAAAPMAAPEMDSSYKNMKEATTEVLCGEPVPKSGIPAGVSLDDRIAHLDEPFSATLLRLIDAKGKTDVEVYKKANIDRKLFSKIRSVKGYTPKKPTILALSVALELSLPETEDLLSRAGYALSHASKFDVIVEFFIIRGNYDIYSINEVLFAYDQPLLGA